MLAHTNQPLVLLQCSQTWGAFSALHLGTSSHLMFLSCLLLLVHVIDMKAKGDVSWTHYHPAVTWTLQGHQQPVAEMAQLGCVGQCLYESEHSGSSRAGTDLTTSQRRGCRMKIGGCPSTSCGVPSARAAGAVPRGVGCYRRAPGSTGALGLGSSSGAAKKNTALMMLSMKMVASSPKSSSSLQRGPAQLGFPDHTLLGFL